MPLCIALAVREMGMTPGRGGARRDRAAVPRALDRDDVGRLGAGARADLVVLDAPTHVHLAYRPGVPLVTGHLGGGTPRLIPVRRRHPTRPASRRAGPPVEDLATRATA